MSPEGRANIHALFGIVRRAHRAGRLPHHPWMDACEELHRLSLNMPGAPGYGICTSMAGQFNLAAYFTIGGI